MIEAMARRPVPASDVTGAFLTTQEAAEILGLSVARVRQLADTGELPSARSARNKIRIYMLHEVEQFKKRPKKRATKD